MKKLNKGFTLVELIIVIAILAIIMLIAIPNFSGIQQRMQVRADKQTAAQIGKAIRIWYAERVSEGGDVSTLPYITYDDAGKVTGVSAALSHYENVAGLEGYISEDNEPNSLSVSAGGSMAPTQYYAPVLTSADTAAKIMVIIEGPGGTGEAPIWTVGFNNVVDEDTGEVDTANSTKFVVNYDGSVPAIAYMEP